MNAAEQASPPPVSLKTFAEKRFLPLILSVVEKACQALGAEKAETLRLVLSSEEIFTHLTTLLNPETPLRLRITSALFYDQVEMAVPMRDIDLRALNLTASLSPEREGDLEEMGLLIAARSVDSLQVEKGKDGEMVFRIIKERRYPEIECVPEVRLPEDPGQLKVKDVTPESLKLFVYQLVQRVPTRRYPMAFRYPGKVVDMVQSGTYGAIVAQDATGAVGGGVLWRLLSPKTAECFGPYSFVGGSREKVIRGLLDGVLTRVARSSVLGLVTRYHADEMPPNYFEELGTIRDFSEGDGGQGFTYLFRMMNEDLGAKVWAHPDIEPFLRETYRRLVLPRELLFVRDEGERLPEHSVIATRFEPPARLAVLKPLWPGGDTVDNLSRHVAALTAEKIFNLLFEVDLGIPEHTHWIPVLVARGFSPRVVLPYAGRGDLLYFQYDADPA